MDRAATVSVLIAKTARARRQSRPAVRIFLSVEIVSSRFAAARPTMRLLEVILPAGVDLAASIHAVRPQQGSGRICA